MHKKSVPLTSSTMVAARSTNAYTGVSVGRSGNSGTASEFICRVLDCPSKFFPSVSGMTRHSERGASTLNLWAVTNAPHVLRDEPSLRVHENGIFDVGTIAHVTREKMQRILQPTFETMERMRIATLRRAWKAWMWSDWELV